MTHTYTHGIVVVVLCVSRRGYFGDFTVRHSHKYLAEQSGIGKQGSGEETQRQKQFGVSQQSFPVGELLWGWGGITDTYRT